jgi:hypothetical protein
MGALKIPDDLLEQANRTQTLEERLPALHRMIDELPPEELELVEQVLARLEMDRLWKEVREGFGQDWDSGKYDRIDEVIREVRESLKTHAA